MIVKTSKRERHATNLQDVIKYFRNYNMHLNTAKCSFGMQVGKFLSFMMIMRGIKANSDTCQVVISMRSPSNVKEV